ncbi:cell envelope integrity protein CreD [uncultured Bilophila sp.]|uniref:cell envelope integrity protein CreD n=1 Tax=uncultured Bilophila sp. TaxID=529385 RepID=UPI00280AF2B6|nr:cell envelope integrity protein CreD [uncultured Bilophila sp.]
MLEVMLFGLLVLVLLVLPLCVGFVSIVKWLMRRSRQTSGCAGPAIEKEAVALPGPAGREAAQPEPLTDGRTFTFEPSGEPGVPVENPKEPQIPVEDAVDAPHKTDKAALQDQLKDSMMLRCGVVAGVALLLLIPLMMVESLVRERSSLYREVVADISRTWGGLQQLSGPYLLVPYTERVERERVVPVKGGEDRLVRETRLEAGYFVILPSRLSFDASLDPESRRRGIYRALVYTSEIGISGQFALPSKEALTRIVPALVEVDYARAFVITGLSHPSALREAGPFVWAGTPHNAEPGTQPFEGLASGFRVPVALDAGQGPFDFSQRLVMSGSGGIRFATAGETTDIKVRSPWPHPSFQGQVLPASYETSDSGFSAVWSVPSLARSYPNLGTLHTWPRNFTEFAVGVDLYQTGTHYKLVERSVKYGALFIGLTFLAFIVFEMGLGARLHPVQYGIVGLSMVVFYLVLLSLSEHLPFLTSYLSASGCIALMVSCYVGFALRNIKEGAGIGLLLVALYTLLYTILQMEDYALLMGTALVLVMLAALMVVSRNLSRGHK